MLKERKKELSANKDTILIIEDAPMVMDVQVKSEHMELMRN